MADEPLPDGASEGDEAVGLDYEHDRADWRAITPQVPFGWLPQNWPERPVRFVDGKDVGDTVASIHAPGGYPAPVRLSQIGSIVTRVVDGHCRREFSLVERVVAMAADLFPWNEIEGISTALQEHGLRFLPAKYPGGQPTYDFEPMRKAAQNRSNDEMGLLEEAALGQDLTVPSLVDGRLEPRSGGLPRRIPSWGDQDAPQELPAPAGHAVAVHAGGGPAHTGLLPFAGETARRLLVRTPLGQSRHPQLGRDPGGSSPRLVRGARAGLGVHRPPLPLAV